MIATTWRFSTVQPLPGAPGMAGYQERQNFAKTGRAISLPRLPHLLGVRHGAVYGESISSFAWSCVQRSWSMVSLIGPTEPSSLATLTTPICWLRAAAP